MTSIRHKNDFYQTPSLLTKTLLGKVPIAGNILEPCAGKSAITKVLKQQESSISAVLESDLTWGETRNHPVDATTEEFWSYWRSHFDYHYPRQGLNWVVTNPPFSTAHEILPKAFDVCNIGVAFLLRSTYSEPCKNRRDWLIEHADCMRYRIDISPRPRFRAGKGTDSTTCTWFVWQKNWSWSSLGVDSPFQFITDWR